MSHFSKKFQNFRLLACVPVVLLSAALVACSSPPKPKVTSVTGTIQAAADVNPSVSQRPSPLRIRIYELKSAAAFNSADFMALFQSSAATLGADVLASEEMTLEPGQSRPVNKQLNAETRFVAVFAAYRDLERATWRAISPVEFGAAQQLTVKADALVVSIQIKR